MREKYHQTIAFNPRISEINFLQQMDYQAMGFVVAILVCAAWAAAIRRRRKNLPPGPRRWPVFGNIFQMISGASAPHRLLAELAKQHGAVMTIQLGSMTTVVVSSSQAARAMFKSHDAVLAGRKIYDSLKGDVSHDGSLIVAQYGPRWRTLRRLCAAEFFSAARLDAMRHVRAACVDEVVEHVKAAAAGDAAVDFGKLFFVMAFNLIGNLVFSRNLVDPASERGAKFFYHAGKTMEWAGKPNFADYWGCLKWFDFQRIRRTTQFHVKQAFDVAGEFLRERMEDSGRSQKDYLDVLLEYRGDVLEGSTINVIVFEMFTAGTDTTTSTLEWAMTELLRSPAALAKVQSELRSAIGSGEKVTEGDLENLPYLKAVIKETLRLHPPLPFLVPRQAMEPCKFEGFHIPAGTQILVNVWAIGRDPETWRDPLEFRPERFLDATAADYKGKHFEFLPFGAGRRICPAVPLSDRVLPLALGSVLHRFDWRPAAEIDMRERMGITLRKAESLKAVPSAYV
ncbi:cytochrome P450 76A1-like [Andrographis paniculata]|uniref:cytochrome P450 76A1-like n=1 Tax=Andrographis paniculata TaxID=175694 RepID=UPI0021E6E600|nr:cytochrome P450 76A1-like [Andrographis paniculata]